MDVGILHEPWRGVSGIPPSCIWGDSSPGLSERAVRGHPPVPRCQWRDLLRELLPGAGDPHLVLGREDPEQGRDVGGYSCGVGISGSYSQKVSHEEQTGQEFPCPTVYLVTG